LCYPDDRYIDIGTPQDLITAGEVFGRQSVGK
jgi:hypothetical protein